MTFNDVARHKVIKKMIKLQLLTITEHGLFVRHNGRWSITCTYYRGSIQLYSYSSYENVYADVVKRLIDKSIGYYSL